MTNYKLKNLADSHIHMSDIRFEAVEPYLDLIAEQGVTDAALLSLTYRSVCYNLSILYWKNNYRKINLAAFGMIHNMPGDCYRDIPYENQVKALLDMGCDGVKLMFAPDIRKSSGIGINDMRYDAMFTYLEKAGVPLCVHVNDPEEFWVPRELTPLEIERHWGYFREGYLSKQEIYDETFEMLDRHPNLKITFAHFFFLSNFIDEAERVLLKYPNVTFDLTPGWEMFVGFSKNIDAWRDFFIKYQDRVLFGTDCNDTKNFNPQIYELVWQAISHDSSEFTAPCYRKVQIRGLGLPEEALQNICYDNYKRRLPVVKPVNMEKVLLSAERLYADIRGSEDEVVKRSADWTLELMKKYDRM